MRNSDFWDAISLFSDRATEEESANLFKRVQKHRKRKNIEFDIKKHISTKPYVYDADLCNNYANGAG
jgi:hypothetical protein